MKKLSRFGLFILMAGLFGATTWGMVAKYTGYLANETGLTYNKTYTFPMNSYGVDCLSFVASLSSVTVSTDTFIDGQVSTGTFTVSNNSALSGRVAVDTFTVISTQTLPSSTYLQINNTQLFMNISWFPDVLFTSNTAVSISSAINALVPQVSAKPVSNTVIVTSLSSGSFANNMTLTSNVSTITAVTANFVNGVDPVSISIAGFNIPFSITAFSSMTALSIANGINATPILNTIVVATSQVAGSGAVVYATSTSVGISSNYIMISSSQTALGISGPVVTAANGSGAGAMFGGSNSAYTLVGGSSTVLNIPNHGFPLGMEVWFQTVSGVAIGGLTSGVTYYVIPITPNSISLSLTSTGSIAGIAVIINSSQTKTTADNFSLNALVISGQPSFQWLVSDDGTNFTPYVLTSNNIAISSTVYSTYNTTGTITSGDYGPVDYAYLRLNVTGPTTGAVKFQLSINGKNTSSIGY